MTRKRGNGKRGLRGCKGRPQNVKQLLQRLKPHGNREVEILLII
jgi:hypothetical protein